MGARTAASPKVPSSRRRDSLSPCAAGRAWALEDPVQRVAPHPLHRRRRCPAAAAWPSPASPEAWWRRGSGWPPQASAAFQRESWDPRERGTDFRGTAAAAVPFPVEAAEVQLPPRKLRPPWRP
jgi:hypothetical protein